MSLSEKIADWFAIHKRSLPWRDNPTPYLVWVSEVMLQQTQSTTVIPYYLKWVEKFPTLTSLANASLEAVLKTWEGLGYYRRAKHLHQGAIDLVQRGYQDLPNDENVLATIRGIGPYTKGAILSFAFHRKLPAVDGNVNRVITRLFAIDEPIEKSSTQQTVRNYVMALLPEKNPHIVQEGLIELGALVCQKKPKCTLCPLRLECRGRDIAETFPIKKTREKTALLYRQVAVIQSGRYFLVVKGKEGQVMENLMEFPYLDTEARGLDLEATQQYFEKKYQIKLYFQKTLQETSHTFTKYKAFLTPYLFFAKEKSSHLWYTLKELERFPFSSGHRKILQEVKQCTFVT